MTTRPISEWRDDVMHFLSTVKKADNHHLKLKRTAADVVHEVGYFFDHQLKDHPGSLTPTEQLEIAAAVLTHIQERLRSTM